MSNWKDLLATMNPDQALQRARDMVGKGTVYHLGRGGFDPSKPLWSADRTADCSGFVAWAIGVPRELPPGSNRWLQTTTYWNGGGAAGEGLFDQASFERAAPGDILVFPDVGDKQGHMGLVSAVGSDAPALVIHCSSGNFRNTGDAIRETDWTLFRNHPKTRLMKVDFDALRALVGIAAPVTGDDDHALTGVQLRSFALSADETLNRVARGILILEATQGRMGGIGLVQDALNRLAAQRPAYAVDVGPGGTFRGFYGPKTTAALKAFQTDRGLPPTGDLDSATLLALDGALVGDAPIPVPPPVSAPGVAPVSPAPGQPLQVTIRADGKKFFASVNGGSELYVGRRVPYEGRFGLENSSREEGTPYRAADYVAEFGHWAALLQPTAMAEGRAFFDRLNTYDRARFTFGFLQFAAHVPDGDFVRMLRRLLGLPAAPTYFADLALRDGRVGRRSGSDITLLETGASTEGLMSYFNPSSADVEPEEVVNAAKMVHWCDHDPMHRRVQVEVGIEQVRAAMKTNHKRYDLGGRSDVTCLLIFDIHHQGRAKVARVREALAAAGGDERAAWEELLEIGVPQYDDRIRTLRRQIESGLAAGTLGRKHYVAASNDFA